MKYLFLSLLFIPVLCFSQIKERTFIQGKVNVPLQDDAANINVYNKSTDTGTITNEIGEFKLFAGVGDVLEFSAVQYIDFSITVNETIVENKKMTVMLREAENPLDEVVVRPYDLSGNIFVDAQRVKTNNAIDLTKDTKKAITTMEGEYTADMQTTEKKAIASDQLIENGLDVANIFRAILKGVAKSKEHELPENTDVVVRKMYDDDFFNEYLNIAPNRINEFIFFVEENGLTNNLLKQENQLDFIQFLVEKSEEFKSR